jgi:diaminobutyrate-2-oxoglutarate transaminase
VNSLVTQTVFEDKAILALLSDTKFAPLFSSRQRSVIKRHVPWTRLVKPDITCDPDGCRVDLVKYILGNRTRLVLKPANLYAGIGVKVGRHGTEQEWNQALRSALEQRYIVQEYVPIPQADIPRFESDSVSPLYVDFSCFMTNGLLTGASSRSSSKSVVNLTAGGACRVPVIRIAVA